MAFECVGSPAAFAPAVRAAGKGGRIPLADAVTRGFDALLRPEEGHIGIIVTPSSDEGGRGWTLS